MFVLPLYFSHREQTVNQFSSAAVARVTRSGFVFDDVSTFEPAGAVHRCKPAGDVTQQTKRSADECSPQFAALVWAGVQTGEHLTNQPAMMPFLFLDLSYLGAIFRVMKRMPVSAISISGCQLTGVGELQNPDQLIFGS